MKGISLCVRDVKECGEVVIYRGLSLPLVKGTLGRGYRSLMDYPLYLKERSKME